jgi:hypothetical protein
VLSTTKRYALSSALLIAAFLLAAPAIAHAMVVEYQPYGFVCYPASADRYQVMITDAVDADPNTFVNMWEWDDGGFTQLRREQGGAVVTSAQAFVLTPSTVYRKFSVALTLSPYTTWHFIVPPGWPAASSSGGGSDVPVPLDVTIVGSDVTVPVSVENTIGVAVESTASFSLEGTPGVTVEGVGGLGSFELRALVTIALATAGIAVGLVMYLGLRAQSIEKKENPW